ncbi:MAG: hypothetical protein ACO28M_08330 [Vulcanococcus sp.]
MVYDPYFPSHLLGQRILLSEVPNLSERDLDVLHAEVTAAQEEATNAWRLSRKNEQDYGNQRIWQVMKNAGVFRAAVSHQITRKHKLDGFRQISEELNQVREECRNLRHQLDFVLGAHRS